MGGRLHTRAGLVPVHARVRVAELLQDALGSAAPVAALDLVASVPAVLLCIDDDPVAAAIGRETEGGFVIRAIAVAPPLRGLGLGHLPRREVPGVERFRCRRALPGPRPEPATGDTS